MINEKPPVLLCSVVKKSERWGQWLSGRMKWVG